MTELAGWMRSLVQRRPVRCVFAYSAAMAQFLPRGPSGGVRRIVDFVDVDAEKWGEMAAYRPWPVSWLYRRERDRLRAFDRDAVARCDHCLFVSPTEAEAFEQLTPVARGRTVVVPNGVDSSPFLAGAAPALPFRAGWSGGRLHRRHELLAERGRRPLVRATRAAQAARRASRSALRGGRATTGAAPAALRHAAGLHCDRRSAGRTPVRWRIQRSPWRPCASLRACRTRCWRRWQWPRRWWRHRRRRAGCACAPDRTSSSPPIPTPSPGRPARLSIRSSPGPWERAPARACSRTTRGRPACACWTISSRRQRSDGGSGGDQPTVDWRARYQARRKPAPIQFSVYSAVGSLESCQR